MREWEPYEIITEQSWEGCSELASEAVSEMLVVGDVHADTRNLTAAVGLGRLTRRSASRRRRRGRQFVAPLADPVA